MFGLLDGRLGPAAAIGALAAALAGCGGFSGDTNATEAEDADGPSVTPGGGCQDSDDCGYCNYCNSDGQCEEDIGACCAYGGDPGWRCSPPVDDCDWQGCPDGQECTFEGCVPVDLPNTFTPTSVCATPLALVGQPLTIPATTLAPMLLDVDGDGSQDIVTLANDGTTFTAYAADGSVATTLVTGDGFLASDWVPGDAGTAWVTGLTAAGDGAVALLDVPAIGELRLSIGSDVGAHGSVVAARDFTGDGKIDLARAGGGFELWETSPGPNLTLDAPLAVDVRGLEAFDFGDDGAMEWFGFGEQSVQLNVQGDVIGAVDWYALPGEYRGSGTVNFADGSRALVLMTYRAYEGTPQGQITRVDTSAGPPALLDPFGAELVPVTLQIADLDGDGTDEICVGHNDGEIRIYALADVATPACHTTLSETGGLVAAGDFSGDGVADLVIHNGTTYTIWTADPS